MNFCRDLLVSVGQIVFLMYGSMKKKEKRDVKARASVEKIIELRHFFFVGLEFQSVFLCRIHHLFYFVLDICGISHPFHLAASKYYILMSSSAPTFLRGLHSEYRYIIFFSVL